MQLIYFVKDWLIMWRSAAQTCIQTAGNLCYYYMSRAATYEDGGRRCRDDGGSLVTVGDSDTQRLLETLMQEEDVDETWLGATMEAERPTLWRYISGRIV